jgi:AAA domain
MGDRRYVVVSGPPGSGKSTLAAQVSHALGLPLLGKDTVKDALLDVMPADDVDASRRLGRAAMEVLFALAPGCPSGAVHEANFHRAFAEPAIAALPGAVLEVFCRCSPEEVRRRYRARAGSRRAGHFDDARQDDDILHGEVTEPVAGGWPVLEVETGEPVNVAAVVGWMQHALPR